MKTAEEETKQVTATQILREDFAKQLLNVQNNSSEGKLNALFQSLLIQKQSQMVK